jgi:hypothetical protein
MVEALARKSEGERGERMLQTVLVETGCAKKDKSFCVMDKIIEGRNVIK